MLIDGATLFTIDSAEARVAQIHLYSIDEFSKGETDE